MKNFKPFVFGGLGNLIYFSLQLLTKWPLAIIVIFYIFYNNLYLLVYALPHHLKIKMSTLYHTPQTPYT